MYIDIIRLSNSFFYKLIDYLERSFEKSRQDLLPQFPLNSYTNYFGSTDKHVRWNHRTLAKPESEYKARF